MNVNMNKEPSGYEADAEQGPWDEEDYSISVDGVLMKNSLEHINAKRGDRGSSSSAESCEDQLSMTGAQAAQASVCSTSGTSTLGSEYDSEDYGFHPPLYQARTCCRPHGKFPKRLRVKRKATRTKWPSKASSSCRFLHRGGLVAGTATNLNDNSDSKPVNVSPNKILTQQSSFRLWSRLVTNENALSLNMPLPLPLPMDVQKVQNNPISAISNSSSTSDTMNAIGNGNGPCSHPENTDSTTSATSENCTVSTQSCSIAEALSFSHHAKLLLEANAPHHVVHHNAAYEFFLQRQQQQQQEQPNQQQQQSEWNSNINAVLPGTAGHANLSAAIQDLFAHHTVTLHPVKTSSQEANCSDRSIVTHFLLELVPRPQASPPQTTATTTTTTPTPLSVSASKTTTPSLVQGLPARAVG